MRGPRGCRKAPGNVLCVSVGWLVVVVGAQQGDGTGLKPHRDLHLCSSSGGVLGCASSRTLTGTVASPQRNKQPTSSAGPCRGLPGLYNGHRGTVNIQEGVIEWERRINCL